MTKDLYLTLLRRKLDFLPADERDSILSVYAARFNGADEDEVARSLGTPASIADRLRRERMAAPSLPEAAPPTAVAVAERPANPTPPDEPEAYLPPQPVAAPPARRRRPGWVTALIIIFSPVWAPLLAALCVVLFSLCFALLAVAVAFMLCGASVLISGLVVTALSFIRLPEPAAMLLTAGCGLICAGLGLLVFWAGVLLVSKVFPLSIVGSCRLIGLVCGRRRRHENRN